MLDFEPMTVLIGPNGVGKSTLIEGLELLRKLGSNHDLLRALNDEHGDAAYERWADAVATDDVTLLNAIGYWLDRLAEDLSHLPRARAMFDLEQKIKEVSDRIGEKDADEVLEPDEAETIVEWIRELERKMQQNLEHAEKNATVLEKKIHDLNIQVDALCLIVGSNITKRGVVRAMFGRLFGWMSEPNNAKLLREAGEAVTKILTAGSGHGHGGHTG